MIKQRNIRIGNLRWSQKQGHCWTCMLWVLQYLMDMDIWSSAATTDWQSGEYSCLLSWGPQFRLVFSENIFASSLNSCKGETKAILNYLFIKMSYILRIIYSWVYYIFCGHLRFIFPLYSLSNAGIESSH